MRFASETREQQRQRLLRAGLPDLADIAEHLDDIAEMLLLYEESTEDDFARGVDVAQLTYDLSGSDAAQKVEEAASSVRLIAAKLREGEYAMRGHPAWSV